MGGGGKKPISNIEKKLKKEQEEGAKKEKKTPKSVKEKPNKTVAVEAGVIERVKSEISKESAITPHMLASRLSITVGAAKHLLKQLETQGEIRLVAKNRRVALYANK